MSKNHANLMRSHQFHFIYSVNVLNIIHSSNQTVDVQTGALAELRELSEFL